MEQKKASMFSLEWFKERLRVTPVRTTKTDKIEKPFDFHYLSIKLVNDNLSIVLKNGEVYSKQNATQKDYNYVIKATNLEDVLSYIYVKETPVQNATSNKDVIEGFAILKILSDFTVENDTIVYLKETNRTLPTLLVNKFIEIINFENKQASCLKDLEARLKDSSQYQAYKNFFLWCCLNPRAEVANSLYKFIEENSFNITKQGFIVALRNVITVSVDTKIVEVISNVNHKIKAVWKKKPEKYYLFQNQKTKEFSISLKLEIPLGLDLLGNVKDLYLNLPDMEENRYTDDYTKTFDIRIGKVVKMPMEDCEWSTDDCAKAGLHFTSKEINYVGCGDTSILILINPMKIVGIGKQKGRCYEYFPIMNVSREESTEILKDLKFDTLKLEEDYVVSELEELEDFKIKNNFATESLKHSFNFPAISNTEIKNIVKSLKQMKNEIKNRVVKIK